MSEIYHNSNKCLRDVQEIFLLIKIQRGDFPGGAVVKNPPARDTGSSPGPGGSHMPRSN